MQSPGHFFIIFAFPFGWCAIDTVRMHSFLHESRNGRKRNEYMQNVPKIYIVILYLKKNAKISPKLWPQEGCGCFQLCEQKDNSHCTRSRIEWPAHPISNTQQFYISFFFARAHFWLFSNFVYFLSIIAFICFFYFSFYFVLLSRMYRTKCSLSDKLWYI